MYFKVVDTKIYSSKNLGPRLLFVLKVVTEIFPCFRSLKEVTVREDRFAQGSSCITACCTNWSFLRCDGFMPRNSMAVIQLRGDTCK